MRTNWKNKLKTVLAENKKNKHLSKNITAINCEKVVSAVNRSYVLADTSKVFAKKDTFPPKCSNCDLEMKLIENKTLWFCPLGCESRNAKPISV